MSSYYYPRIWMCLVAQSCPTLCDPINCSLPGSFVHGDSPGKKTEVGCHVLLIYGIFPTQGLNLCLPHCGLILNCLSHQVSPRILEWVAHPFSREFSWPRKQTGISCIPDGFFTSLSYQGSPIWISIFRFKERTQENSSVGKHSPKSKDKKGNLATWCPDYYWAPCVIAVLKDKRASLL